MTNPRYGLGFRLAVGVESKEDWEEESDEFLEWLEERVEGTDFSVKVHGPSDLVDYEPSDDESPFVWDKLARHQFTVNWE